MIEHLDEGRSNTIAVGTRMMFGQPYFRELMTPGVSMSDTRFLARRYMAMMAHLPVLFAQKSDRALLICYGVGNTARALLSHPDLGGLDVVDISQEAISSSPWFAEMTTGDPLTDARTTVTIDDGRHHLVTTDQQYDVITSEPPPPNHAGVVNLYTREYYAAARRVLAPGGVLAQWLPIFQLSESDTRTIVSAFVAEFPHTALFYGARYQWIHRSVGVGFASSGPLSAGQPHPQRHRRTGGSGRRLHAGRCWTARGGRRHPAAERQPPHPPVPHRGVLAAASGSGRAGGQSLRCALPGCP